MHSGDNHPIKTCTMTIASCVCDGGDGGGIGEGLQGLPVNEVRGKLHGLDQAGAAQGLELKVAIGQDNRLARQAGRSVGV